MNPTDLLEQGLSRLGLNDEDGYEKLKRYLGELELWNGKLGLVNASGGELIVRHVLDSLAGFDSVRELGDSGASPTVADLGSGGGFPGLPLACFLPDWPVALVERSERKCGFLRNAVLAAKLGRVGVISEDLSRVSGRWHTIIFRALSPLTPGLLERLGRILEPGGAVCAYKGRPESIESELSALPASLAERVEVEVRSIEVPFLDEARNLVIIRGL